MTITTSKTLITKKTPTGEKANNNAYLLHTNYENTTLSNTKCKHHVH